MTATEHDGFDETDLRRAFGMFPSGVTAFCGLREGEPVGMAVSSFASVSLQPALVSVCVASNSDTWPKLAGLERLGLSVLSSDHGEVARALASKQPDRFADIDWHATDSGAVFVHGAALWLECALIDAVRAGDHEIAIMQVVQMTSHPDAPAPLVFYRSSFCNLAL